MNGTTPIGRTSHMSIYSPGKERPSVLHGTWLEAECFAYPGDSFTRRAYVELHANPHNAIELPYGRRYVVACKCPDTFFSIPARLRFRGRTIAGFVSIADADSDVARFTFTPEADAKFYTRTD